MAERIGRRIRERVGIPLKPAIIIKIPKLVSPRLAKVIPERKTGPLGLVEIRSEEPGELSWINIARILRLRRRG